jgi:23S rRNA pseudouridine2605 synthase
LQRLQKILASAGWGSRRACEDIIRAGRVRVNGQPVKLGDSADPAHDAITMDGKLIHVGQTHTYIVVYKPKGVIGTTWDERGRQTVRDLVAVEGQLAPVGRLDMDSEGLMLLTNDGELTHRLTHPRYEHEKEYQVLVSGQPDEATLNRWRRGVELPDFDSHTLDGGRTLPAQVEIIRKTGIDGTWLRVTMREGRKRQIRRVASLLGHPVKQLVRVRIGPLRLGDLKPGQWRDLTPRELQELKQQIQRL